MEDMDNVSRSQDGVLKIEGSEPRALSTGSKENHFTEGTILEVVNNLKQTIENSSIKNEHKVIWNDVVEKMHNTGNLKDLLFFSTFVNELSVLSEGGFDKIRIPIGFISEEVDKKDCIITHAELDEEGYSIRNSNNCRDIVVIRDRERYFKNNRISLYKNMKMLDADMSEDALKCIDQALTKINNDAESHSIIKNYSVSEIQKGKFDRQYKECILKFSDDVSKTSDKEGVPIKISEYDPDKVFVRYLEYYR